MRIIEQSYSAGLRMKAHEHSLPSMSILMSGSARERFGRRSTVALPFSVSLMAAGLRHEDEIGPDGATLFRVDFGTPAQSGLRLDSTGSMQGWTWLHGGASARHFLHLVRAARGGCDPEVTSQLVADVLAVAAGDEARAGEAPSWLEQVREAIDDLPGWPRVSALAASAGVHRVQLARQFRQFFGCSVSDYIRRRRVQQAAATLTARRCTVSSVAHSCGFHDHAHLCRAFREVSDLTPTAFRASLLETSRPPISRC